MVIPSSSRPLILGCAGTLLSAQEAAFFAKAQPFGFILFGRNIDTPEQVRAVVADLRAAVGWAAPVLIDQEGGRVQRLRAPHWRDWPAPLDQTQRAGPLAARAMFLRGRIIGAELSDLGIDVNCAPLGDIAGEATHPFLRNRCYGTDAAQVVELARAMAEGMGQAGVLPVIKHLPGHGRGQADSHQSLPVVATDAATLEATDFAVFRALSDLPIGMTAHLRFAALDNDAPATTSPRMIALIREHIGFDGLLMTDDISMGALSGDVVSRAHAAWAAGCDVVLHCNGDLAEMQALAGVCDAMVDPARARADAALGARRPVGAVDIAALWSEFGRIMGQG
ncbi:glycoside hydrolase family 3 N-terminal domain-containing protein [Roseicitreum antarcticum]|uniref:beta-N-acetylhexosaminidase n=1 Tax=Roseicitreum antarcticum TaxID=564137 RepID=A0A1H3A4G1_9RHOB|nr:glycoside hydrolase family 3 N-terminal domain-containing protein [Roseicitreum antarcticum]SDX24088.1 beta-N-acetylhexosaminidase [Roseicitreum antarcticum]